MLEISSCKNKWIWSLIFIRIPKNASTSLYKHLGDFNLVKKHEKSFNVFLKNKVYRGWFSPTHAKPNEIAQVLGNAVRNYMSFAVVRNPYDRMVSMYRFAVENELGKIYGMDSDISFTQFCEILNDKYLNKDKNFIATHSQTEWTEGIFTPNFILKFENLKKDFENMLLECNIKHIASSIPHENSSSRTHYRDYYNSDCKKITEKIFEKDLDTFKYLY
jgi:hypothetical protein